MPANSTPPTSSANVSTESQIEILLEEYRQLYALVLFRLAALDQRVPLAGVALIAAVAGISSLATPIQTVFLIALPLSLLWWLGITTTHARSFEDALRRIEQIEKQVNALSGTALLLFQSSHPGRGQVGGRTGQQTVQAVLTASAIILGACGVLAESAIVETHHLVAYEGCLAVVGTALLAQAIRLQRYAYRRSPKA